MERELYPDLAKAIIRLNRAMSDLADIHGAIGFGLGEVAWRLMSIPGVGPLTAMAFIAAIEDVRRFSSMRDIGAYLGLTPKRYQSGETDVRLGISKQGDDMARHYLYEAANSMLSTVKKRFGLRSWGLQLLKTHGAKKARVAVARKLAVIMGRMWKDGTHFEATPGAPLPKVLPA